MAGSNEDSPIPGVSDEEIPLTCLVYGQGRCDASDPHFVDYERRLQVQQYLASLGVDAALPEDIVEDDADGFLVAQIRYAVRHNVDFIVVLQPPEPEKGPPTLKIEVMDLYYHRIMRCRTFIYSPRASGFTAWEEVVRRFAKNRVHYFPPERYGPGDGINDHLDWVIGMIRARKRDGTWPPQCAPPPEIV